MPQKLPRFLITGLACLAVLSFGFSLYLEGNHLDSLQRHPIMANLMSGVVGFSSGILAVAIGFNWLSQRERIKNVRGRLLAAWQSLSNLCIAMQTICWVESPEDADDVITPDQAQEAERLIDTMIKFGIPYALYLLNAQDDFLVMSHYRLAEKRLDDLRMIPADDSAITKNRYLLLSGTVSNLVCRMAEVETGKALELGKIFKDLGGRVPAHPR